ncbi:MAG: lysophospholipid acyltransferase family protein [Telluria sp.]
MRVRIAARLVRVLLHLLRGLAICTLVFPWIARERRLARVARWSSQLLDILHVAVEVAPGCPPVAGGLWVANHVSWVDIFVINAVFPSRFVAKSDVRQWPLIGALTARAGTIFVERSKRRGLRQTVATLAAALAAGERIVVFPEGTSAAQGALLPFRANLFEAALQANVAVQPVAISYFNAEGKLHDAVEYIGSTSFAESMVSILSGKPIRALLHTLPALSPCAADRRALAQHAHQAIGSSLAQGIGTAPMQVADEGSVGHVPDSRNWA